MSPRTLVLAAGLILGCRPAAVAPPEWHQEAGYRWRALAAPGSLQPGFTSLAPATTGVSFQNFVSDSATRTNRILAQGSGVALGDVDGDGLVDMFFGKTEGKNALYRNRGGFKFDEVAASAGVAGGDRATTGVTLADVDGDRDLDLILNALGGPNALYRNDGAGRFVEDTLFPGRASRLGSTTSTLADVDGDGDLDLYVANYKAYTTLDRMTPQERAFDQIVRQTGPKQFEVAPRYQRDYRVVMRDDLSAVTMSQRSDPDYLFLNDGSGHFALQSMAGPRWLDARGNPLASAPEEFSLAAKFYDVDNDGDQDLYVANDFEDPDRFWINDGRGTFRLIDPLAVRATSNSGMGVDFGDINRDGFPDLFETDMLGRDSRQLKTQIPTHTVVPKEPGVIDDRPQMQRNTLSLNRGDGTFAQVAEMAGVDATGWSWGTIFLDVDLDGYEDILVATGHPWDVMDADTEARLKNRLSDRDWHAQRDLYPKLPLLNVAYRNLGTGRFVDATASWRFSASPDISHGIATADLDGDGDLDVVINRLGSPALILRNDATAPRVAVRLEGAPPNGQGIGAEITVRAPGLPDQSRQLTAGGSYLSHSDAELAFATGGADSLTIEVRWPSGRRSRVTGARPGRLYQIAESAANPAPPVPGVPAATMFEDRSADLGHSHRESMFDEATRQSILPNAFSQLGPGVSWFDLDRDGDQDLLIGNARGNSPTWYRNDRDRFAPVPLGGLLPGDATTFLPLPIPNGTTVLVGQSSYEANSLGDAIRMASVIGYPLGPTGRSAGPPVLATPGDTASIGPLAMADYDRDGDLDLFVGARIIPGSYPVSPSSRLYRNDGTGSFSLDTDNAASLKNLGMVSAAIFADMDGDSDADLVLAIEWGRLTLLVNEGGRFTRAPASSGFDQRFSRWLGIATGDFNEDGRLDLVATSWGTNGRPRVDSLHPLLLTWGPFGPDSSIGVFLSQLDDRIKKTAPLVPYARLTRALPSVAERVRTFTAYADASVDDVLGPAAKSAVTFGATSLEHVIWFNRGGGRFEAVPLPALAQQAPAFAPVVADFDGDGHDDLFLSQNFFPTELNTPRYDAGRSLLLLGDGTGQLKPVPGQRSGLMVYGDQRGAATADYDADGRNDLVVTQNGTTTRLFRNATATPGLTLRLQGPPTNPFGVGAQIRLVGPHRAGPTREIQAGSSYWSQSSLVAVLGHPEPTDLTVEVRWPGGKQTTTPVPPGTTTLTIEPPR